MALPQLLTVRDLTTYRYSQVPENLDTPVQDILARAEAAIQARLQRPLKVATFTERFVPTTNTVFVLKRPLRAVVSLKRRASHLHSWETIATTDVRIESGPGYFEPYAAVVKGYEIEVIYSAGMFVDGTALYEDIREAILLQSTLFSYQDLEIYGSGDSRAPGIVYFAQQIDALLAPYMSSKTVYH